MTLKTKDFCFHEWVDVTGRDKIRTIGCKLCFTLIKEAKQR